MGNSSGNEGQFNTIKYQQSGLKEDEIVGLKNVFDSLEPKNGVIETSTLKRLYRDSYDASSLNLQIGNKETLNFDQFFDIMSKNMMEKKQQFKDVEFEDNNEGNAQCLFCQPYQNSGASQTKSIPR